MACVDTNLPLALGVLVGLPEFEQLRGALAKEKTAHWQVLSHHTTTSCQPGRAEGVAPSLRAAGMDTKLGESGAHLVEVYLENSFAHGDGLWVRYVSATLAKFEDCKAEAALGLFVP